MLFVPPRYEALRRCAAAMRVNTSPDGSERRRFCERAKIELILSP